LHTGIGGIDSGITRTCSTIGGVSSGEGGPCLPRLNFQVPLLNPLVRSWGLRKKRGRDAKHDAGKTE